MKRSYIKGYYRDCLVREDGKVLSRLPLASNTITQGFSKYLAMAMRPGLLESASLYLALGSGNEAWDSTPPQPSPEAESLFNETCRKEIGSREIGFITEEGEPAPEPTHRIEITLELKADDFNSRDVVIREAGLVCSIGQEVYLLNHIIHPRISLNSTISLIRKICLNFDPVPHSNAWSFGMDLPVTVINGIGSEYTELLEKAGIRTIEDLVHFDFFAEAGEPPGVWFVESRARGKLLRNRSFNFAPFRRLSPLGITEIISTSPESLSRQEEMVTPEEVCGLQDELSVFQLIFDHKFLAELSLGDVMERLV